MRKFIRILEVPLLLLASSFAVYSDGSFGVSLLLLALSIVRLWVNVITDSTTYKN